MLYCEFLRCLENVWCFLLESLLVFNFRNVWHLSFSRLTVCFKLIECLWCVCPLVFVSSRVSWEARWGWSVRRRCLPPNWAHSITSIMQETRADEPFTATPWVSLHHHHHHHQPLYSLYKSCFILKVLAFVSSCQEEHVFICYFFIALQWSLIFSLSVHSKSFICVPNNASTLGPWGAKLQ